MIDDSDRMFLGVLRPDMGKADRLMVALESGVENLVS